MTVDEIAYQEKSSFTKHQSEADISEFYLGTEKILLVKPTTFMNESGRSVRPLMDYYNIDLADVIVVYDDMDLPIGSIRLRQKGSAGGHNGIKSLIQHFGTQEFNRVRVGIGRPNRGQDVIAHVLSTFPKAVHEEILLGIKNAADASLYWAGGRTFLETMNQYNSKNKEG